MKASNKPEHNLPSTLSLIHSAWGLYRSHATLFIGYSAWLLIPFAASMIALVGLSGTTQEVAFSIIDALQILLLSWIVIAIALATHKALEKRTIQSRTISSQAWSLLIPFLLVEILVMLLVLVGLVALIIPGILIGIFLTFAPLIIIFERIHIRTALKKSIELVRARFFPIASRLILGNVLLLIPYLLSLMLVGTILLMAHNGDIEAFAVAPKTLTEDWLSLIVEILLLPLFLIYAVVLYKNVVDTHK